MFLRSFLTVSIAVLALAGAVVPAGAEVNVAVGNGDKITGTLLPASEVETFRVNVPKGAVFKLKVKGRPAVKKGPKPPATLRLLDPDGAEVGAALVKRKATSATLKGYTALRSGEYRIQVSGDGETSGNYLLVVKWKSPTQFTFDLDDSLPNATGDVRLPLDAGSRLKIKLSAAKGSTATPAAERLVGPDAFEDTLDPPTPGAPKHALKNVVVPEFGDTVLETSGGGAYRCTVTVKVPAPAKRKISLTSKEIGGSPFGGGDTAIGQVVSPLGGSVAIDASQSPLVGGASVLVPAGAISGPTAILIGESAPLPNQDNGQQGAGPSVFFGPEGLTFANDVTVTIPWDAESFGDRADEVRVYTRDADGNVTEILDFELDVEAGTATFPVSHFSSFRVFGPMLPAPVTGDLDGDGLGDLVLRAPRNGAGVVYVTPGGIQEGGSTADAPIVLTGDVQGDRFGTDFAVCDLNQDGREDLVVSANRADIGGRVYVFFGRSSDGPGPPLSSRSAAQADVILTPQQRDLGFGIRLACGDVNGDQIDDLIVGAEGSSVGASSAGAVYIFFGAPEFSSRSTANADVTLLGKRMNDGFGAAVAVGDVTGDSIADVIVGAEERNVPDTGSVYVFAGGGGLKSLNSNKADFVMSGVGEGDRFGLELAVGDIDGDGFADVAVSSPGDDTGGELAGAVFVHFGGRLNDPPAKLTGASSGDDFGFNLSVADLQGDGSAEVIASSGNRSGNRGSVHIFSGVPGFGSQGSLSATSVLTGEQAGDVLRVVQRPYDITGDSIPDLVIYAPGASGDDGRAYIVFGGATLPASGSVAEVSLVYDGQPGDALGGDPIP